MNAIDNAYETWRVSGNKPWPYTNGSRAAFIAGYELGSNRFQWSNRLMKYLAALLLLIACMSSHAQTDIGSTNVLLWNAVTNDSTGLPLTTNATYLVGVFTPGTTAPFFASMSATNELPVIQFYGQLQRDTIYELKVRAMAFGYTESDWSDPLAVRRPRGKVGKPTITGVK